MTLQDSPLSEARKRTPHSLLYFQMLLLQRLVDQYWKTTASGDKYVQHCVTTMHKCPPAIIGLLVYLEAPRLSPSIGPSFPATKKQRIFDSESGRAASHPATAAASASSNAPDDDAECEAFWAKFVENVMKHIVWPVVHAGHITSAPNEHRDNPELWCEDIAPILADARVFLLYWKGGKERARGSWSHVCRELATHPSERQEATVPFIQKTLEEFLAAAGYQVDAAATTRCKPSHCSRRNDAWNDEQSNISCGACPSISSKQS